MTGKHFPAKKKPLSAMKIPAAMMDWERNALDGQRIVANQGDSVLAVILFLDSQCQIIDTNTKD